MYNRMIVAIGLVYALSVRKTSGSLAFIKLIFAQRYNFFFYVPNIFLKIAKTLIHFAPALNFGVLALKCAELALRGF